MHMDRQCHHKGASLGGKNFGGRRRACDEGTAGRREMMEPQTQERGLPEAGKGMGRDSPRQPPEESPPLSTPLAPESSLRPSDLRNGARTSAWFPATMPVVICHSSRGSTASASAHCTQHPLRRASRLARSAVPMPSSPWAPGWDMGESQTGLHQGPPVSQKYGFLHVPTSQKGERRLQV